MMKSANLRENLLVDIFLLARRLIGSSRIEIFWKLRALCFENARCLLRLAFGDQQPDWHRQRTAAIKIHIFIGQTAKDFVII